MTEHYVILFNSHCSKHFMHIHSFRLLSDETAQSLAQRHSARKGPRPI